MIITGRRVYGVLYTFFTLFLTQVALSQSLNITGNWKVSWEDNKAFSKQDYDDAAWEVLPELKWTDNVKKTASRMLWVRKTLVIPSSLKAAFEKTGLLTLSMGKILQSDNTYLNGKPIGTTGSGDSYRNYLVKKDDINWDQENTIAIRVGHWGSFAMSQTPRFESAAPEHFFSYKNVIVNGDAKAPVFKKNLTYQLWVDNKSPKQVTAKVKADFYNFEGEKINTAEKQVTLSTDKNEIDFTYTAPVPFVKIVYTVAVPDYGYQSSWNAEFGYQDIAYKSVNPVIPYKAMQKFYSPDLDKNAVGGWLGEKLKANTEQRLHKVDELALLAGFINRPGSHSWIGEHIGKFLEAACNAYANNHDPELKNKIDRSAQQLIAAQLPDGYLGTYDMDSHWTSWDVWSHRYDLMGLLRYYQLSGFKPSLDCSKKIGDLLIKTFGDGKAQKDIVRAGGHVGMAATCVLESMAELYRFSGEKKYLDFCYYVIKSFDSPNGPHIISTLDSLGRVDKVANAKAYEMMSNFLGIVKLYRLTNDEFFLNPLLVAWNDIVANRLYITGTTSSFEHFQDDDMLPASSKDNMGEGCVTTTWVQFNYQLLCITGDIKYVDELERSVYNHLTGAENPQTGCVSYYTPLMGAKPYGCSITCCMSSVPRAIAMIPLLTNGKMDNKPTFLFYQPGVYSTTIASSPVAFTTTTNFPADGAINIVVDKTAAAAYALAFRKPYWAAAFSITVNGKKVNDAKQEPDAAATVSIKRIWNKGDKIAISFTMPLLVLDGGNSYPGKIALQRGPQILVFDKNINNVEADAIAIKATDMQLKSSPGMLPAGWVGGEAFGLNAVNNGSTKNIILVPYADASQTGGAVTTWMNKASN